MINEFIKKIFVFSIVIFPNIVFGQNYLGNTRGLLSRIGDLVKIIIPIVFALAVLLFFWGVAKYILSVGTKKEEGKQIMVWGVIALFVMSSIWGLVAFLGDSLKITPGTQAPKIPSIKIP